MHRSPLNSRSFFLELFNFGLYELVGEDVWEVLTNIRALRIAQDSPLRREIKGSGKGSSIAGG